MKTQIPAFEKARVMVVGDVMLDRYWQGGTDRISPEAPVPIVHVNDIEDRPGGAANVALNISALTAQPILLGVVGQDREGEVLEKKLEQANVTCFLQKVKEYPTVTKLRILSLHQQLIRLDFEKPFTTIDNRALLENYQSQLSNVKAVILSDYHKGTLQDVQTMIVAAKRAGVAVFIDPKGDDLEIYRGATILTPNRKEFEAVVGRCKSEEEFIAKGRSLLERFDFEALLITRGAEGMTLLRRNMDPFYLSAHAREVYDVTGAGDTVISVLAASVAAGADLNDAVNLANTAAGIVVTKLGAASVTISELRRVLRRQQSSRLDILSEEEAIYTLEDARANGETVVMTNGCFDLLHAGHVTYLEQARALGKRLLIAVNDDQSVARLKGPQRPINKLAYRMRVLAALQAVDWVVPFSEDTPERLIRLLKPDVLVKGGDYKIADIAGSDFVLQNGGEVKVLAFESGCSTSNIIKKIKEEKL